MRDCHALSRRYITIIDTRAKRVDTFRATWGLPMRAGPSLLSFASPDSLELRIYERGRGGQLRHGRSALRLLHRARTIRGCAALVVVQRLRRTAPTPGMSLSSGRYARENSSARRIAFSGASEAATAAATRTSRRCARCRSLGAHRRRGRSTCYGCIPRNHCARARRRAFTDSFESRR